MSDEEADKKEYERLKEKLYPKMDKKIDNSSAISLYLLSFIIPVVGFIVGALYIAKEDRHYTLVGRNCLILSICNLCVVVPQLLGMPF